MKILRTNELAELLSVSKPTLWRMQKRGDLPPKIKLSPRCVGWKEDDINVWLKLRSETQEKNG